MDKLQELRKGIDEIDLKILDLLNKRLEIVKEVGHFKKDTKATIYRPEREKAIIDRLEELNDGSLNRSAIEAIFLEIFAVSRNYELPEKVAYLGPEGSFTHQAAESRYGYMSDYQPLVNIEAVFQAVETERVRFGVVPVENNQEGVVQETMDLLGTSDVMIVAEIIMPIHFAFAAQSEDVKKIDRIYSKDIAFKQCRKFLSDTFSSDIKLVPVSSTSTACKMALEEVNSAAICSPIAAKQYHLPIQFQNIEDSSENHTRFLILGKQFENAISGSDKTSILAKLPHEPGSLVNFLQKFHEAGINLTKVESRPAKVGSKFKYIFYIDFDGHFQEEKVQEALADHLADIKWLGSYVKINS